jgi:hypothetical protein
VVKPQQVKRVIFMEARFLSGAPSNLKIIKKGAVGLSTPN